jgi:hypothetical protein
MTHPSLAAADPRRADDVYADARETLRVADLARKSRAEISN